MKEKNFKIGDRVICKGIEDGRDIDGLTGTIISVGTVRCGIEFDKHMNGHTCMGKGKSGHCWNVTNEKVKLLENETIVIYRKDNEVIALDKSTGKKAIAKCSPDDEFNFMTGAKIAFDRLTNDNVKEVRRLAKVGEYIKIVNPSGCSCDEYVIGDILKVVKVEFGRTYYKNDKYKYADEHEYVVLEGYEPVEEPKALYNGKVVCVKAGSSNLTTGKIYEFENGTFYTDDGIKYPLSTPITDIKDLTEYFKGVNDRHNKRDSYFAALTSEFIEVVE